MLDKCEMPTVAFHALLREQPNEALLSLPFILIQACSSLNSLCSLHLLNAFIYQIVSPHFQCFNCFTLEPFSCTPHRGTCNSLGGGG
ncbi:hypothetical protein PDJAM_G00053540, partial [Pangasius djambal]|nr:hypothetical protein [Pangasius djambal]